jgi:hypothetical protein
MMRFINLLSVYEAAKHGRSAGERGVKGGFYE